MKEEKEILIEKIIIKSQDEITDIVRKIRATPAERILLTFTESNDLLISPINLKVLKNSAQDQEKDIIAQIIHNPTGVRNANIAGLIVTEAPNLPPEELWEKASVRDVPVKKKTTKAFSEQVNNIVEKSNEIKKTPIVEKKEDDFLKIDSDIKEVEPPVQETPVIKKDFVEPQYEAINKDIANPVVVNKPKKFNMPKINLGKIFNRTKPVSSQPTTLTRRSGLVKLLPFIGGGLVLLVLLSLFIYYKAVPKVRIQIYVESLPVSIEKNLIGDPNINELDLDTNSIPIRIEEISKSRSQSATATGVAYKGEKATGVVTLKYFEDGELNISAGTRLTDNEGFVFVTTGAVSIIGPARQDANVEALEVGQEYNIAAGHTFSVAGFSDGVLTAENKAAFKGGSKTQYTVLAQTDVDTVVESLTNDAKTEGENDLRSMHEGWTIIDTSIKCEPKEGSVKTDVAVGSEVKTANVSLTINCSGTFYLTKGVEVSISSLLTDEAKAQNLFESDDQDLVLGEDIEKTLEVGSTEGGTIQILLKASGFVKPKVDKEKIAEDLAKLKWDEGIDYINDLSFAQKKPDVMFIPDSMPENLWYFPNRQGSIIISEKNIDRE